MFIFNFKSIKKQINVATGISLGAAITVMIIVGTLSGQSLYKDTSETLVTYSENIIGTSLKRIAGDVQVVNQIISDTVRIAKDMASSQEFLIDSGMMERVSREEMSEYVRHILSSNQRLLGAYITWEKNAIDGADAQNINRDGHSDNNGQFGPYWTRSATGTLGIRPVGFEAAYNGTQPNARGVRPGEWFLCTFESNLPCVSDPAVWDVQGKPTLMTSITAPVIRDSRFVGLAGADISMAFIQDLSENINEDIYQGAGQLRVISYYGSIVADTRDSTNVGSPLEDKEWEKIKATVQNAQELVQIEQTNIRILLPMSFDSVENPWAVELVLPTVVAMAEANRLNTQLSDSFSSNLLVQLFSGLLVGVGGFAMVFIIAKQIAQPVRKATSLVTELSESDGDLTKRIDMKLDNEIGTLANGLNSFLAKTHEIVKDTCNSVKQLRSAAETSANLSDMTNNSVTRQESELEEVTRAVSEMSKASSEVANNCSDTANSAESALDMVRACASELNATVDNLHHLTENMRNAAENVDHLESATQGISGIIEVIKGISEQTNLLALNAAIEAARAGEQGRGFAVVADEVRNLATRTKESTVEINELIETLISNSSKAVGAMREGTELCEQNMTRANESRKQLEQVVETTQLISEASMTIASAVEEQNVVANEISRNVTNINEAVHQVADYASESNKQSHQIEQVANDIESKLNQFKY